MLNYSRTGSGEPLVLIHGLLGTHQIFESIIPILSTGYDVIAIDLPGHGQSPEDAQINDVYQYTEVIFDLLDDLKINKSTWVGHSLGGFITYAAVEKYPERLNGAVAVYASPVAGDQKFAEIMDYLMQSVQENGSFTFAQQNTPTLFAKDSDPQQVLFATRLAKATSVNGIVSALNAIKNRPDQVNTLNQANLPILVLEGEKDPRKAPFYTSSPSVTVKTINTSHMGMLDDPDTFLHALLKWMKNNRI